MKKRVLIALVVVLALAATASLVYASVWSSLVVSGTDTLVYYVGYVSPPAGWNTPGFDDSAWTNAVLYQHANYLEPTTESPFAGTGAQWISYAFDQTTLPDYNHPSMNPDGTTNFAAYLFRKTFNVPATAYNVSGSVAVAADNYGWLYLNGDPSILGPKDPVGGYNFRPGEQNTGTISAPSLVCTNVLAALVENGAKVSGTGGHGPMGLLFLLELNYEVPDVVWQPPVTNLEDFVLQDGTTLPLKFKLYLQDGTLITGVQTVHMTVEGMGFDHEFCLGDGRDMLRFDPYEYYYIANFHTRDFELPEGDYIAAVRDDCSGEILGSVPFYLSPAKGTGRGKH